MRVLVACEFSGIVRDAFELYGHDALSCDILPSDRGGKHYQGDVMDILNENWDLIIAHPPCTYLCNAQLHLCRQDKERAKKQELAIQFVKRILNSPCKRICIENPRGILHKFIGKPNQVVEPWYFGSPYSKDICLWTKNLPLLKQTHFNIGTKKVSNHTNSRMSQEERSKIKSRFFPEVALAMAEQWNFSPLIVRSSSPGTPQAVPFN